MAFKKGQSGNPGGKSKDGVNALAEYRAWLATKREVRRKALKEMLASDDEKIRMAAVQHADAYDYGKPAQSVDLQSSSGSVKILIQRTVKK